VELELTLYPVSHWLHTFGWVQLEQLVMGQAVHVLMLLVKPVAQAVQVLLAEQAVQSEMLQKTSQLELFWKLELHS
jgi:hypothetical protein